MNSFVLVKQAHAIARPVAFICRFAKDHVGIEDSTLAVEAMSSQQVMRGRESPSSDESERTLSTPRILSTDCGLAAQMLYLS
jgi:hypothetical protein